MLFDKPERETNEYAGFERFNWGLKSQKKHCFSALLTSNKRNEKRLAKGRNKRWNDKISFGGHVSKIVRVVGGLWRIPNSMFA